LGSRQQRRSQVSPYHVAGSVDLDKFHAELKERVFIGALPDMDRLHSLAQLAVSKADQGGNRILQSLRFGEEWLSTDEEDREPRLWYMILLALAVTSVPDLSSNRGTMSWYVLDRALPRLGWSDEDSRALIYGRPLPEFLKRYAGGLLEKPLTGAFGGYLLVGECRNFAARLMSGQDQFRESDPQLASIFVESGIQEPEALENAYLDVLDMLEAAVERGEDLFMNLD